jgi:hypothetical protein
MTSRLSSLLVRDGVVGVKRMEKAFQRQVLFGGGLDTILLEMTELNEQRLLQYLSLATGLPPATARELDGIDPRAAARCPRALAERFRVVPLSFDGDALRVLTHDPVDLGALEDLASELGAAVQPFVAPEFRFELAFDRVYGRASDDRYAKLAAASRLSAIPPVGRAPSVVVEASGSSPTQAAVQEAAVEADFPVETATPVTAQVSMPAVVEDAVPGDLHSMPTAPLFGRRTSEMTAEARSWRREETERQAAEAYRRHKAPDTEPEGLLGAETTTPSAAAPVEEPAAEEPEVPAEQAEVPAERAEPEVAAEVEPEPWREVVIEYDGPDSGALEVTEPLMRPAPDGEVSGALAGGDESAPPIIAQPAAPTSPVRTGDSAGTAPIPRRMDAFDPTPLAINEARTLLAQASHRDAVFEILLRAVRARTWYVSLLTVQGGAAIGRVAIAGNAVDQTDVTQVLIPLDTPSAFRQAVSTASPYIGPVATGDNQIDGMIRRMGGVIPPSALLLPIVLRNRVVALLVGHRGADMLRVTEVSELLPLSASAGDALGRIIRRGKAQSRQMAAVAPPPDPPADPPPHAPRGPVDEPGPSPEVLDGAPTTRMAVPTIAAPGVTRRVHDTGGIVSPEIEALMLAVEGTNETAAHGAMLEALARADAVRPWLRGHFPGRISVHRAQLSGGRLPAGQHGRLLDLVVRMGEAASDLVSAKLRDNRAEVRYYAALCAAEMRLPSLVEPLAELLFDSDAATRDVALDALASYPHAQLEDALMAARSALRGQSIATIEAAATAVAALADVRAIPELLNVHALGGDATTIATRALVSLTKQDFGPSNRKWRQWWDKNRKRNRVEWLLEGLAHKDTQIRRSSAEDLRKATGEYFGYHHDLPRREREQARQRWLDWWNQTGRLRFLPGEDGGSHQHQH